MAFVAIEGNPAPEGAVEEWFEGKGGARIRAAISPAAGAPRGSVILLPGRTEFIEKYFEVMRALNTRGFNVFCIDWRGQGLSAREAKNPEAGHYKSIDDLVDDLEAGLRQYTDRLPEPRIVLAHSMGGAIALRALQTGKVKAAAAAFSAPMWGIAAFTGAAKNFARAMVAVGAGQSFAPGTARKWAVEPFDGNPVTHDEARHTRCQRLIEKEPRLALAGPTLAWVVASAAAMDGFAKPGALANVRIPVLVATASEEALVDNRAHDRIAAALPDATHITIAGAKHEILMERDELQRPFWEAFDALADRVAPRA